MNYNSWNDGRMTMEDGDGILTATNNGAAQGGAQQLPQSIGALLVEEQTMNPMSVLPSFFEMQLVDATTTQGHLALKSMWEAAMSYLEKFVPDWMMSTLKRYSPECRFLLYYWMEKQSLHSTKTCASLAESVYGLKRSKLLKSNVVTRLSNIEKTRSALLLALVPYLQERFSSHHQHLSTPSQQPQQYPTALGKYKAWFLYLYPFFYKSSEFAILFYQFAYLMGRTLHYKPSHHFFRFVVRRVTLADYQQQQQQQQQQTSKSSSSNSNPTSSSTSSPASPSLASSSSLSSHSPNQSSSSTAVSSSLLVSDPNNKARKAVYIGIASMLFVGWWANLRHEIRQSRRRWIEGDHHRNHNSNTTSTSSNNTDAAVSANNSIPPPQPPKTTQQRQEDKTTCPLCRQPHVNPVASTSGYVYCQSCLINHIRHVNQKCPMTGMTCYESQIFRIYEPTSHPQQ